MDKIKRLAAKFYKYRASVLVYGIIGGISALVNWYVFYILHTCFMSHYVLAALGAFVIATGVNYLFSDRFGFVSAGLSRARVIAGVYLVSVFGLVVDLAVLVFLFSIAEFDIMVSKILGTAAAFFINFAGRQFFVFARHPRWSSMSTIGRKILYAQPTERD